MAYSPERFIGVVVVARIPEATERRLCPEGIVIIPPFCVAESQGAVEYKTYMCVICGFIYEEEKGLPEEGFAPGTRWEDIPENWVCPDCDAGKEDFEMVEI